jgi:hypothetical protein
VFGNRHVFALIGRILIAMILIAMILIPMILIAPMRSAVRCRFHRHESTHSASRSPVADGEQGAAERQCTGGTALVPQIAPVANTVVPITAAFAVNTVVRRVHREGRPDHR